MAVSAVPASLTEEGTMASRKADIRELQSALGHSNRSTESKLRTFYHTDYFRSAARYDRAPKLSATRLELLDLYDEIANSPEFCLDMELKAGDIQWLSNHTILHGRSEYSDDPDLPRHLLRLWLSAESPPSLASKWRRAVRYASILSTLLRLRMASRLG